MLNNCVICYESCDEYNSKRLDCNYNVQERIHNDCIKQCYQTYILDNVTLMICPLCRQNIVINYICYDHYNKYINFVIIISILLYSIYDNYMQYVIYVLFMIHEYLYKNMHWQSKIMSKFSHYAFSPPLYLR